MNYKLVLKTYSQLRQLTDDETALLNTLRGMTDAERELLAETLGPPAKVKAKSARPATKKFKKCDVCGVSKRAAHHRDADHPDYHVFDEGAPKTTEKKSARASSLAEKIAGTASGNHKPLLCSYEIDGKVCHGEEEDGIHDATMGYAAYHEFIAVTPATPATQAVGEE